MKSKIVRGIISSVAACMIVSTVAGCSTLQDRAASQPIRHPCGNIYDICKGDSAVLDTISRALGG